MKNSNFRPNYFNTLLEMKSDMERKILEEKKQKEKVFFDESYKKANEMINQYVKHKFRNIVGYVVGIQKKGLLEVEVKKNKVEIYESSALQIISNEEYLSLKEEIEKKELEHYPSKQERKKEIINIYYYSGNKKKCVNCSGFLVPSSFNAQFTANHFKIECCNKCNSLHVNANVKKSDIKTALKNYNVNLIVNFNRPNGIVVENHKRIVNNSEKKDALKKVYVYKSINNTCKLNHKDYIEEVPMNLKNIKTGYNKTIRVFHCTKCDKYFITIEAITKYTENYYMPQFKCIFNTDLLSELNEISLLGLYGYNVREDVLSNAERHTIIDFVLKHNIMSSQEIISLLEFNIRIRKNNRSMQKACKKWHDDIQYIYNRNI